MKFVCDYCGKPHDTLLDAESCEKSHEEELKAKAVKKEKEEEINKLIHSFYDEYGCLPAIRIDITSKSGHRKAGFTSTDALYNLLFGCN